MGAIFFYFCFKFQAILFVFFLFLLFVIVFVLLLFLLLNSYNFLEEDPLFDLLFVVYVVLNLDNIIYFYYLL